MSTEVQTETPTTEAPAPQQTVNLDSLNTVQCLNVLWSMLNQASSKGAFTIDESYVLKVIFQKITANLAPDSQIVDASSQSTTTESTNVDV